MNFAQSPGSEPGRVGPTRRTALAAVISGVGFGLARSARSQTERRVWRIGLFHVGLDHVPPALAGMKEGMRALGYEEGKNVVFDFRNLADTDDARSTVADFVRQKVDLIVAFENQPIRAAKDVTTEVPVIMLHLSDPVADGFVASLARPGGNITGFTGSGEMQAKELALFKELVPSLRRPLLLYADDDPASIRWLVHARDAGRNLGLQFVERQAHRQGDVEQVFAALKPGEVDGVFICSPHLRMDFHAFILEQAAARRIPVVGYRAAWVEQGALFSYSADFYAVGKSGMARQADKLLRGAKPADLPVEQISQFQLVVNRKVATGYGMRIPQSILLRADRVIDE
jgi:putative ABC transport system substrate-binding protein